MLRIVYEGPGIAFKEAVPRFAEAQRATARETAAAIQERGRADIAGAGNFGPSWTRGYKSRARKSKDDFTIKTTIEGRGWRRFQTGQVIRGRPLLWLPLSGSGAPRAIKNFSGSLLRVDREGGKAPLMISLDDHKPKYVGLEQVVIPKKFHLIEIAQEEAAKIVERFRENLRKVMG